MNVKILQIVAAMAFLLVGTAAADTMPESPWHPPAKGVVQDKRAAITIAHAVWLSMNPDTDASTGDEKAWQAMMTATLDKGVWQVVQKDGQGLVIDVAQHDARIVDIYVVQ